MKTNKFYLLDKRIKEYSSSKGTKPKNGNLEVSKTHNVTESLCPMCDTLMYPVTLGIDRVPALVCLKHRVVLPKKD